MSAASVHTHVHVAMVPVWRTVELPSCESQTSYVVARGTENHSKLIQSEGHIAHQLCKYYAIMLYTFCQC